MISFIREILAIPLRFVQMAVGFVPVIEKHSIARLIYLTTGSREDAIAWLFEIAHDSELTEDEYEDVATTLLNRHKDARIAYMAVCYNFQKNNHDADKMLQWLFRTESTAKHNRDLMLVIKFHLLVQDRSRMLDKMIASDNLPMLWSAFAHSTRAFELLREGDFDRARQLAEKHLEIRDDAKVRLTLWVCHFRLGNMALAQKHFDEAMKPIRGDIDYKVGLLVAEGWLFIGDKQQACRWLDEYYDDYEECLDRGIWLKDSQLVELAESEMFRNF